ncbi:hypothetical protein EG68_05202 [Paragonimus skrjabini miyazakii]|uniref:Peptidase S54 rhomboid domain-containing protein n=1 Tax=Paragonimus skrjabini miyazakii TaxID=59628 RepID=A0A8S9YWY8_9TREM|nr:hypothetical protein EG68_05202 [Paragonimus skrjabini miyazakii]
MHTDQSHWHKLQRLNVSHHGIALCLLVVQSLRIPLSLYTKAPICSALVTTFIITEAFGHAKSPIRFCVSLQSLIIKAKWYNIFVSHFCHVNEWHLYHNLTGFIRHAVYMEKMIGCKNLIKVLVDLLFRSQLFHLILNNVLYIWTSDEGYANDCYIGISGLVFAINVLSNFSIKGHWEVATPLGTRLHISKSLIAWLDLFLIQFPIPTSSFVGHCAGVLAGLSYKTAYFEKYGPINFNELERLEDTDEQTSSH